MKKTKVIQLIEDLKVGGLERVISSIAYHLDSTKYDLEIWCIARGGEVAGELKAKGVKVRILDILSYYNPLNILKLSRLFKSERVDILHCHGYFAATIGRISGLLAGVSSLVVHIHTIFYQLNKRNVLIDKFLNFFTKKIIFISCAAKDSFLKAGYDLEAKAQVIYNGIEDSGILEAETATKDNIILIVASLFPHKGHIYLLKAIAKVIKEFPDLVLWVVGDGPLKDGLQQEADNLGIAKNVSFFGVRENVLEFIAQAAVCVLPSIREGLGMAAIEAMSQEKAVIASRVGGILEVVLDGESGYLVPPQDVEALAEKIMILLRDKTKREAMGKKGRELFEDKFKVEIMIAELEKIYQKLAGGGHGK